MLGLTLAYRLAEAGDDVTVVEARPSLGGLADAWSLGKVRWDRHYHVILLSDTRLRNLLRELGLEESIRWVETKTGFYCGGKFYSLSNTMEFLKFPPLNLLQKLRLGGTIFYASKVRNWRRMERISVESWLRRWSGDSTFEAIWLPLLRAKLGNAYRRTAASFIWAYISRMYKARRTGHKKEMFGYVPGGYGRIIDQLSTALAEKQVRIDLNQSIRHITSVAPRHVGHPRHFGRPRTAHDRVRQRQLGNFRSCLANRPRSCRSAAVSGFDAGGIRKVSTHRVSGHRLCIAAADPAAGRLLRYQHHRRGTLHRRDRNVDDRQSPGIRRTDLGLPAQIRHAR